MYMLSTPFSRTEVPSSIGSAGTAETTGEGCSVFDHFPERVAIFLGMDGGCCGIETSLILFASTNHQVKSIRVPVLSL